MLEGVVNNILEMLWLSDDSVDGDEASEETARTNLDLKLELARMRKLHKHANEVGDLGRF